MFFCNFLQTSGDSGEIWHTVFWMNLFQNDINVLHLMWIVSLHYPVKLGMLIVHLLPLNCYRKKLHLICVLQICQIWIQLITPCRKYYKRLWMKYASLIWRHQRCHWQIAAALTTWSSWATLFSSRCFSSFWSLMHILYTFSCTCRNQLDWNLANLLAIVKVE